MRATRIGALLLAVFLTACTSTHLIYVQDTVIGVDASVSAEGPQKLQFGFARDAFALVPQKAGNGEAMSAASFSYYEYQFVGNFDFNHFIATGNAAKQISRDPETLERAKQFTYLRIVDVKE